jgi:hypothetical protein
LSGSVAVLARCGMQLCTGLYGTPRSSSSFERTKFRNSFFSSGDEKEARQRVFVRFCITNHVSDYVDRKDPSLWIIGGQEFDDAEPVLLILPVRLKIVFNSVPKIARPLSPLFRSTLAIHRRYTERRFLCIPYCYLQGITVRPVPCEYNVIQHVSALSRR